MSEEQIGFVDIKVDPISGSPKRPDCRCSSCRKSIAVSDVLCSKCGQKDSGNQLLTVLAILCSGVLSGGLWFALDRLIPQQHITDADVEAFGKMMQQLENATNKSPVRR